MLLDAVDAVDVCVGFAVAVRLTSTPELKIDYVIVRWPTAHLVAHRFVLKSAKSLINKN